MKKFKKISIEKLQLKITPISVDNAKKITGGKIGGIGIWPCAE